MEGGGGEWGKTPPFFFGLPGGGVGVPRGVWENPDLGGRPLFPPGVGGGAGLGKKGWAPRGSEGGAGRGGGDGGPKGKKKKGKDKKKKKRVFPGLNLLFFFNWLNFLKSKNSKTPF